MGRSVLNSAFLLAVLLLWAVAGLGADQTATVREAVAVMQRGDFSLAEKILRTEVQEHPDDAWSLSLLGVTLDNQKRVFEADEFHGRALAKSPRSADILNNYGTHLWIAGQYDKAESIFASALAAAPGYFKVLFNLGVMASYTGHYERAREVLEAALRQQPKNVDVLYRLGCVEEASRHWETAVLRLAQAAKLDPVRADVQKRLAVTSTELGALEDGSAAWERYLKLEPNDDAARRERAYTAARMGKVEQGVAELQWYLERHPDDPVGHYELGQAQRTLDMTQALAHLSQALALNSTYAPARTARGSLYYQLGNFDSAVKDLEAVESAQPEDAENLDRLGQTYQALERASDAVRVLRRAAELAPDDSKTVLHFARALADVGQPEESKVVMNRFRQLGPEKKQGVPAGLVEYLSLEPEQRHAEYKARVERAVRDRPEDPAAQLVYLKLMLEDGNTDQVAPTAKRIAALKPGAVVLAAAGRALLEANQYALARDLLRQSAVADPQAGDVALVLAVATFRAASGSTGAKAGLELMDRTPESARRSDYYLARAEMLYASGKIQDGDSALDEALRGAKLPDLFQQATALLVRNGRASEALRRIAEAARILPENREILLFKATTLEFARQAEDAEHLLNEIQSRWPEWSAVWVAHGLILYTHQHYDEAQKALETAVALGARGPETYFFLADCMLHSSAERKSSMDSPMDSVIRQALQLSPNDWRIQSLAGRIALAGGEYQLAVDRQLTAIRLHPHFVAAHNGLAQAYAALGRMQEAEAELERVRTIENDPGRDDEPPYTSKLFQGSLFKEKPPRVW